MIEVMLFFLYTSLFYIYVFFSAFMLTFAFHPSVVFNVKCFEMNSYYYNIVPLQQRVPVLV